MEEDIKDFLLVKSVKNKLVEQRLEDAIKEAEKHRQFEEAHNPEIRMALDIVKEFIIKKKLICYGGTAMNALLPKKDKFYDPEYDLPDYDFYTIDASKTVNELVKDLKKAGFKNIYPKMGMHEGTQKIAVNYIPIADITEIHKDNYDILFENSKNIGGIRYANQDVLRMMMYLEISRPQGEVDRWKKVYQRLQLINKYFPIHTCKKSPVKHELPLEIREILYSYIIYSQRVVANIELEGLYKKSLTKKVKFNTAAQESKIIFYSPNLKHDAKELQVLIPSLKVIYHTAKGEFLAERLTLLYDKKPLAIIVGETACHSFNNVETQHNDNIRIASLETLIALHYSFYFFSKSDKTELCDIGKCISTFNKILSSKIKQFKAFPTPCTGYQKGFPTLLHEKRLRTEKARLQKKKNKNTTLKKDGKQ